MIRARFFVAGEPATQGSKRIVQPKGHRRPMLLEVSKKLGPWRAAVQAGAMVARQRLGTTLKQPVAVCATFWCKRPKRPARPYPVLDLDKLQRALFDGLVEGGLIVDDSWIVDVIATKRWCEKGIVPGCDVMVTDF